MQEKNIKNLTKEQRDEKDKFIEDVVKEVESDFISRQKERLNLERQWELNLNFLVGNQCARINAKGQIDQIDDDVYKAR